MTPVLDALNLNDLLQHVPKTFFEIKGQKNLENNVSFYALFEKDEEHHEICINLQNKHEKTGKETSNLNSKSELLSKIEKFELRGSVWRFIKFMLLRVIKFKGEVKSYVSLPRKNKTKLLIESEVIMWN